MGLLAGFVFAGNRRVLLALLAVAISVTYSLIAAATISGLRQAQAGLGEGLPEPRWVVVRGVAQPFGPETLPREPDSGIALARLPNATYYVVRIGEGGVDNASFVAMGPASGFSPGGRFRLLDEVREVKAEAEGLPVGADWIGVAEPTFRQLGGVAQPSIHVAAYRELSQAERRTLEDAGFSVARAPAMKLFYEGGTDQLVSAVWITVLASTVVVAVVTSGFMLLELRALRRSIATLRMFAGTGLVARLLFLRGIFLLLAGHAIAILGTQTLLFFLRAAKVFTFSLPWSHVAFATAVTLGGGLLGTLPALWTLRRPLEARALRAEGFRSGTPRLLRLVLASKRSLIPLAAAATILAATLGVVLGTLDIPGQIFGRQEDEQVISSSKEGNPLRTTVHAFVGTHIHEVEGFEAGSPEIFVPSHVLGRPVMVRGVSWPQFAAFERPEFLQGGPPQGPLEAVVGSRLARLEGIGPGDRLVVPSSYRASVIAVDVSGVMATDSILQDEILIPLETARSLTGLLPHEVNLVRVRVAVTDEREAQSLPVPSGIEVVSLNITPLRPVPNETATAHLRLVNFAPYVQSRELTLRVNGVELAKATVSMEPYSVRTEDIGFRVPQGSRLSVQVNPTFDLTPEEPAYVLEAPGRVSSGSRLTVVVRTLEGDFAPDVRVSFGNETALTGASGNVSFLAGREGNNTILAEGPAGRAARSVFVLAPGDEDRHRLRVREIVGPAEMEEGTWRGTAIVDNVGGKDFSGTVPLVVDGSVFPFGPVSIPSAGTARVAVSIGMAAGTHEIGDRNYTFTVKVTAPPPGTRSGYWQGSEEPTPPPTGAVVESTRTLEELLEARRAGLGPSVVRPQDPEEAFLGQTYENVDVAVTLVALATVLHSGLIVFVTVQREVEQRSVNVGTLAVVGADRRAMRQRALREFGFLGFVSAALGTAAGLALAWAGSYLGWLNGFGHALQPRLDADFAVRLTVVSLLTILAAAVIAVEHARTRNLRSLLTQGPSRRDRPPLDLLLEGRP